MTTYIALYNPYANNGAGEKSAHRLDNLPIAEGIKYVDITTVTDYREFFHGITAAAGVIICGGDGTLNRFINETRSISYGNRIYYFACGTGNDFLRDIGREQGEMPAGITDYIQDLPTVRVNGREYRFLNNVGFGIDGYCTQVGDEMRAAGKENINYSAIAVRGLLGGFHPVNAAVTVDGTTKSYRNVWLAPTMNGRYYGGGMMPAPLQDRTSKDGTVSVMVYHTKSRLRALMVFPSIFQGEHIKHKDMVDVMQGHEISVKFERPCPLQIDGETIPDVTEYEVHTGKACNDCESKRECIRRGIEWERNNQETNESAEQSPEND